MGIIQEVIEEETLRVNCRELWFSLGRTHDAFDGYVKHKGLDFTWNECLKIVSFEHNEYTQQKRILEVINVAMKAWQV